MNLRKRLSVKWIVFISFAIFTAIMLVILWVFQTIFLGEIYKAVKIGDMKACAEAVSVEGVSQEEIYGLAEKYNVGIRVLDKNLNDVALGSYKRNSIVEDMPKQLLIYFVKAAADAGGREFTELTPESYGGKYIIQNGFSDIDLDVSKTIIYSEIMPNGGVIMVETVISPVSATIDTLRVLLIWATCILIVIGLVFAIVLSRKVAKPIVKINESAKLLATGRYDIDFNPNGYREITELADTLNYAEKELSKVDGYRKELIANVSHDLRTPLTMITAYSEMMRDLPGEQTPENIQVVIDEAKRLTTLVNDLLDMSKMEAGKNTINPARYDLTSSIEKTIERYSKLVEKDGYVIEFLRDEHVDVYADEVKITQAVYNLINNAITYTGEDKKVIIRQLADKENGRVRIEVEDSGEGIPKEYLASVWDRYYKVDKAHKRAQVGTGLGLFIVKGVMDMHMGRYGVRSTVGKGSIFWFEIDMQK